MKVDTPRVSLAMALGRVGAIALAAALAGGAAVAKAQPVRFREVRRAPAPERMEAKVLIAGDASRLERVDVARIAGDIPPPTYSGDLIGPYDGFSWYVSRHYAIASDMDADAVRDALVLLELAWPQYGRIFGWRPAGGLRMAIIMASSREVLEECIVSDAIFTPLLGGLTQEGLARSYLYAGTPYQTRYILLHEATHLYQYCLSGDTRGVFGFLREGIADYFSSHIYDPVSLTLSVNVLDRAPIHNHLEAGLAEWERRGRPRFSQLVAEPSPSRGMSVLLVAYLSHTPSMEAKWRLLCERIVRDTPGDDAAAATLATIERLYGAATAHDGDFEAWMGSLAPTFTMMERDFDQIGHGSFVAMPVTAAMPRLRVNAAPALATALALTSAPPFTVGVEPSAGSDAGAGFSGHGISFSISNTWSGACVFTASSGGVDDVREVPAAFMRGFVPPFEVSLSKAGDGAEASVADANGQRLFTPMRLGADVGSATQALELFAWGGEARFRLPCLDKAWPTAFVPPPFLQEMVVAAMRDAGRARWISSWRVAGPFGDDVQAVHADAMPRQDVQAHAMTAVSPPLVNLCEVFGVAAEGAHAVAETVVECDEDEVADLVLGVADGVEVFVNGERVGEPFRGRREWRGGNVRIDGIRLAKGANRITLHLAHAGSAWLLSAHLE